MVNDDKTSVLREIDDQACRQAKTLIRTSRFASLSCLDAITQSPLVSQVNVAADIDGAPVFLISSLSSHFSALGRDPRCALLLGVPGKGDPAAHPRISVMGHAYRVEQPVDIDRIRRRFLARHPKSSLYVDFADFAFWRLEPAQAALNGGFGKAYEMSADHILSAQEIFPDLDHLEAAAIAHMNSDHSDAVALFAVQSMQQKPGNWQIVSLDCEGFELMLGDKVARLWFDAPLTSQDDLRLQLTGLAQSAKQAYNS